MEIIETGNLRRIELDNTEEVRAINAFYGIYGVGTFFLPTKSVLFGLIINFRAKHCSKMVYGRMQNIRRRQAEKRGYHSYSAARSK